MNCVRTLPKSASGLHLTSVSCFAMVAEIIDNDIGCFPMVLTLTDMLMVAVEQVPSVSLIYLELNELMVSDQVRQVHAVQ